MKLLLQIPTAVIVLLILTTWLASLRLVVLPPGSYKLTAMTALVFQGHGYRLVDSPQAMCTRQAHPARDCDATATNKLAKTVLLQLPYSQWLYEYTDPDLSKQAKLVGETPLRSSIE
ncbi:MULTISPECIES: hypothetical protein [unclassified Ensifer]|uniref:hypothetical protein n=1 Tax=unclassified Ensifer TaxID=2633371 RepID=UPI000AF13CF6|nr:MULTISPECIES: hypothetical protein [unclassified Ensifer]